MPKKTLDRKNITGKSCLCGRAAIKYASGWVCERCSKLESQRKYDAYEQAPSKPRKERKDAILLLEIKTKLT